MRYEVTASEQKLLGVADHVLYLGDHFLRLQRLSEEAAVGRNINVLQFQRSGHQDDEALDQAADTQLANQMMICRGCFPPARNEDNTASVRR